jgi:hypothetical protein
MVSVHVMGMAWPAILLSLKKHEVEIRHSPGTLQVKLLSVHHSGTQTCQRAPVALASRDEITRRHRERDEPAQRQR